jgi:hypothetical protein
MRAVKNGHHMGTMNLEKSGAAELLQGEKKMKLKRYCLLLGCSACGMWSGWVSNRYDPFKGPPREVNTVCSSCSSRLRFTRSLNSQLGIGSGAHRRTQSVFQFQFWSDPSTVKSEAARINKKLKKTNQKLDNIHNGKFQTAKEIRKKRT